MNCTRLLCLAASLGGLCASATAGTLALYTFGGDFVTPGMNGAPVSLNTMDPTSAASVTGVLTPVGGGNIGFNGGLAAFNNLLYAIGNDSLGVATLYSLQTTGLGLAAVSASFNTSGDAAGVVFQNGLASVAGTFYAVGAGATEDLYQIGSGTATHVAALNTFGGTFAGLAWDSTLGQFYGIIAGATDPSNTGDLLVQVTLGGSVTVVANLTALGVGQAGTHLGGLADSGAGTLYDIYTDPGTQTGQLEQVNVGGPGATTLYDTNIPLAQNAGIALIDNTPTAAPEPAAAAEMGGGLVLLAMALRKAAVRGKRS